MNHDIEIAPSPDGDEDNDLRKLDRKLSRRPVNQLMAASIIKLGGLSLWFSIGEIFGIIISNIFPHLQVSGQVSEHGVGNLLGHAIGTLLAGLDWYGVMPHTRRLERCLLHANQLMRSGLINNGEWERMRADCIKKHS
jgi:hypothetical protein